MVVRLHPLLCSGSGDGVDYSQMEVSLHLQEDSIGHSQSRSIFFSYPKHKHEEGDVRMPLLGDIATWVSRRTPRLSIGESSREMPQYDG